MASPKGGAGNLAGSINRQLGITGGRNPQTRFYNRVGTSGMGGNSRTRGRQAPIRQYTRGR